MEEGGAGGTNDTGADFVALYGDGDGMGSEGLVVAVEASADDCGG
jgi:hypothetical protein